MNAADYGRLLDEIGAETIDRYDREESGGGCFGTDEYEQGGGAYTFGALCRSDQIAIMRALDENLPTRTARVNKAAGNSYGLKHTVEHYLGFYVSNLQTKVAMRLLGYQRGGDDLNPSYNVSKRERREFDELSRELSDRRSAARRRVSKREEQQAAARYFYKLTKTA